MNKPYVGVTGIMSPAEARACIDAWREAWAGREPTHDLMLGVLASDKTLLGRTNKYPLRYPRIEDVGRCFVEAPGVVNLVHYAGDKHGDLLFKLNDKIRRDGLYLGDYGFQFNGTWPERIDLVNLFGHIGQRRCVLQVGPNDVAASAGDPLAAERLCERLQPYVEGAGIRDALVTDVLIDASGGRGIAIDPAAASRALRRVESGIDDGGWTRLGVAGGLCAETLPALGPLLRASPDLSIDAEGRLRDDADGGGNLDLPKVRAYLGAAVALITTATP